MMAPLIPAAALTVASTLLTPVSLTDRLYKDKRFWKLTLCNPSFEVFIDNGTELCRALGQNTTVTAVELTWEFLQCLRRADQLLLVERIGQLQCLKELQLKVELVVNPISVLTAALKPASHLRSLCIEALRLSSTQDVVELADAIKGLQRLRQINLSSGSVWLQGGRTLRDLEMDDGVDKIVLDPLLEAMSSLPVLEHIRLQLRLAGREVQPPRGRSLRLLCHSPRQSLIFNSCGLSDKQCVVIANELIRNNASASLSVLVVTRNYQITAAGWDAFVTMLEVNDKIMDFHQGEQGQWNAPSPSQRDKINYFLRLNQLGRGELLRGPMKRRRKVWFSFLVRGIDSLDMIFFALLVDPSLYLPF